MKDDEVYHERQRLQLCLLHSLNNLLQARTTCDKAAELIQGCPQGKGKFTRKELDTIADGLSDSNGGGGGGVLGLLGLKQEQQHRNAFTGNYDANVLMAALASRGLEAKWYDRRRGAAGLVQELSALSSQALGIIANSSSPKLWGLWKGRHWIALRRLGDAGVWYNLDSDLARPAPVLDLARFLDALLAKGGEIFIVARAAEVE